jgi:hypothetical protein
MLPTLIKNTTGLTKAEVMAAIEKNSTNIYRSCKKNKGRRYGTHYKNNDLYFGL